MLRDPSAIPQMLSQVSMRFDLGRWGHEHRVDGPEDKSKASNGGEEGGGLLILALDDVAAIEAELVDDNQVGNAGNGVPSPLGSLADGEGGKEPGDDHDQVSDDGDQDIGTGQASQDGQIAEQKRGGDGPVDVTSPVDLALDGLVGGRVAALLDLDGVIADAILNGHGEVGNGSKGGDEGRQDVEEAFLLSSDQLPQRCEMDTVTRRTAGTRKAIA